ncbi:MAG: hypothetical protein IT338_13720 [Thermomicrobiales bacterium]|nr:hypothetical protein [Thermomicrobiales bacterium]
MSFRSARRLAAVMVASVCVLGFGIGPAVAQSGTPAPVPASLDGATVVVYQGTCDKLGTSLETLGKLDKKTVVNDATPRAGETGGVIESSLVVPNSTIDLAHVPEVWMLQHQIDPNLVTTKDQQRAMTVETGSGSETHRLACGDLPPNPAVEDTETQINPPLYVDLAPTSDQEAASFRGFARFVGEGQQTGNVLQVVMFPIPPSTATPAP